MLAPDRAPPVRLLKEPVRRIRCLRQDCHGTPITEVSTKAWHAALEQAGIDDFRWDDLRRTSASWLVQAGTPLLALQELAVVERGNVRCYAHLAVHRLTPFAERLCKPLAAVPESLGTNWSQFAKGNSSHRCKPWIGRARAIRRDGIAELVATYGHGPARIQFLAKDPRGFAEFAAQMAEHSAAGSANTMEGYQGRRPCLYDLTDRMAAIDVPMLVMSGDEDELCLEPSLLIKRVVPKAGLSILPRTGHVVNLEEPQIFNYIVDDFLHQVDQGRWGARDPRAKPDSIWGPSGKPA